MVKETLDKILGFGFLGDFAEYMNNKKMRTGIIGFLVSLVILLVSSYVPGSETLVININDLLALFGDVTVADVTFGSLGLTLWGALHKLVKGQPVLPVLTKQ